MNATRPHQTAPISADGVAIRAYRPDDAAAVEAVRQRDTRPMPEGALIVAEVNGEVAAARSLTTGEVIADPFRHTTHLVSMLETWARRLGPQAQRGRRLVPRWRRRYPRLETA